jgi:hypothetical protein
LLNPEYKGTLILRIAELLAQWHTAISQKTWLPSNTAVRISNLASLCGSISGYNPGYLKRISSNLHKSVSWLWPQFLRWIFTCSPTKQDGACVKACDLVHCRGKIWTSVAPLMTFSVGFPSLSGQQKVLYVQLGHDSFFPPHASQIHYSVTRGNDSVIE